MFSALFKKEIASRITTPRVYVSLLITILLVIISLWFGTAQYLELRQAHTLARLEAQENLSAVSTLEEMQQAGIHSFKEPEPMIILVLGVEGNAPQSAELSGGGVDFADSPFSNSPLLASFRWMDIAFVIGVLGSLLAILFSYDALSGEKQNGTLKQMLATPLKRHTIVLAKFCANALLLVVPFIITITVGVLAVSLISSISFTGEQWVRISIFLLLSTLYLLAALALGLLASAMTRSPRASFLLAIVSWFIATAVLPRVAVLAGRTLQPIPSIEIDRRELDIETAQLTKEFTKNLIQRFMRMGVSGMSDPDALRQRQEEILREAVLERQKTFEEVQEKGRQLQRQRSQRQAAQLDLVTGINRIVSPPGGFDLAAQRILNTDTLGSDLPFRAHAREESRRVADQIETLMLERPDFVFGGQSGTTTAEPMDLSHMMPASSSQQREPLARSLSAVSIDIGMQILYLLTSLGAALLFFQRYDVR